MNNVLSFGGGPIFGAKNSGGYQGPRIPSNSIVSVKKIDILISQIKEIVEEWDTSFFLDPVVSIKYSRVIPKSLRMSQLFKTKGQDINDFIIGSSYCDGKDGKRQIIVYLLSIETLELGIEKLQKARDFIFKCVNCEFSFSDMEILNTHKKERLTKEQLNHKNNLEKLIKNNGLQCGNFCRLIQDIYYIDYIYVEKNCDTLNSEMFVSFYNVGLPENEYLKKLNIPLNTERIGNNIDGFSYRLKPDLIKSIRSKYPYLISMAVSDISSIDKVCPKNLNEKIHNLPNPTDEPVIGLLDGPFDKNSYFASWVSEHNSNEFNNDSLHGTAMASLITHGNYLNPDLEDGCGLFRVRHFDISENNNSSSVMGFYKSIENIVRTNTDIKVWNISWGMVQEVDSNSISPIASLLDWLQTEYDVLFVVCGTNNNDITILQPRIGSPADSINSIVVNAIDKNGNIPSYARKGPVLSFFQGPDLCAIGGNQENPIKVGYGKKTGTTYGTSCSTCWVTRKAAYLIYRLKCSREAAKALLIDAAYGWSKPNIGNLTLGAGVLPKHINEIIKTDKCEYKVIINGNCSMYNTYSYKIPVPLVNCEFPYNVKATLCYFPCCSRKQGVDYTNTELDFHFGRLRNGKLESINNNLQGEDGIHNIPESSAKKNFRKWDSVKHVVEKLSDKNRPKKAYDLNGTTPFAYWGFKMLKVARNKDFDKTLNFAIVLTFRAQDLKNRINEFVQYSRASGWIVNELDIDVMNEIYVEGETDLFLDE